MGFDDLEKMLDGEMSIGGHKEPAKAKPCLMIVDDDRHLLDALSELLGDQYELVVCSSGEEALLRVDNDVHVVLLDIKMKGLNGFEVFEQMKKKFNHLPIIFHSAYQDAMNPYEVMNKLRPYGYIQKGNDDVHLMTTLERAVRYRMKFLETDMKLVELMDTHTRLKKQIKQKDSEIAKASDADETVGDSLSETARLRRASLIHGDTDSTSLENGAKSTMVGLGNVIVLLKKKLVEMSTQGQPVSLAVLELDRFFMIQKRVGLESFSSLIDNVSEALAAAAGDSCVTGRMGQAKFAVIMPGSDSATACKMISKIQRELSQKPYPVGMKTKHEISITTSIGVVTVHGKRPPESRSVISAAEKIMARVKSRSGDSMDCDEIGKGN